MFNLNENEQNFLISVDNLIDNYIKNLPSKYSSFLQLKNGNRFRPLLVYYGYTLNSSVYNENIIKIAYSIELIHKASTIIDDIIDQDVKRRELDSTHIQYSENEAIILSIHMLGEAYEKIYNEVSINNIISLTIKNMCIGILRELNMSVNCSLDEMKEIINLQTVSIIKNSLLIGFSLNKKNLNFYDIEILGSKLGYLFQLLNDCESIFNYSFINKNKGNENFDYNKSRKNICISYLQSCCNKKELKDLSSLSLDNLFILFKKYKIYDSIREEIFYIKKDIYDILNKLSNMYDISRLKYFIDYTINIAENRANIT